MANRHISGFHRLAAKGLAAFILVGATSAHANPEFSNDLQLVNSGIENNILIETPVLSGSSDSFGNSLQLRILGDHNGGLGDLWDNPIMFSGFGRPGIVSQTGLDNEIVLDIDGNSNLFSALQAGQGNFLSGEITGFGNTAAVAQAGYGNRASFTQNGTGNALAISQTSW
jgi:hypothetical protein